MYAIVDIAGKQHKVEAGKFIYTNRLEGAEGTAISFDQVLLVSNGGSVEVGAPVVTGAKVSGKIVNHLKDDKVLIFKKKRRKGYRKFQGHRQSLSKVLIENIVK
ncbi:MAG TPA: 50S ribosomal protein L21 [Cytophagaceae bacterium]|jgi:large subunit ribosomal protein L21|nr:50S ribosomal protein L21 [Cytophagaceae bacterium]